MSHGELPLRHEFVEGTPGSPVLLMLHGTGGTPHEMLALGRELHPDAALLAPAGRISENGTARWFRRYAEGVFDEEDVLVRAEELAGFVQQARRHYGVSGRGLVAVGFSNGANIAAALTLLRPDVLTEAVLFAGMLPLGDPPRHSLRGSRVWMSNGDHDPMAPSPSADRLAGTLRARGAGVAAHRHPGGHEITAEALRRAADRLREPR
ncbi:phospholipase [Actinopolyspora erythraea]|uniref:Phospholipase n=1 Tax=Actinopolyspora erythraea TaxID=414996 RepID=A0A099D7K9_9ACTN|nr:alpha/beta hydrolase [Actinopolyspora erythraea]ASU78449.1 phospholipase [Actinopolyspora erythraea]KGI82108.1 phospholipase [Actinopolyspora erythraea]